LEPSKFLDVVEDPIFGCSAQWISLSEIKNYPEKDMTVVDHPTIIATHVSEVIKMTRHE
jgi:flagellar biosynthesis component FlhA